VTDVKDSDKPSFEESLERLEEIAAQLDSGGMSLDESLEMFEEAMELVRFATDMLHEAEGRVEELIELNEDTLGRIEMELDGP